MKNKKLLSTSLLLILFLAGCGSRYQARTLKGVKKKEADFIEKKDNVELRLKELSSANVSRIFNGQRTSHFIKAVLLTIKNDSSADLLLDEKAISFKLLTAKEISSKLSRNVGMRVVAGLAAWPLLAITCTLGTVVLAELLFGIHGCTGLGLFMLMGAASVFVGIPVVVGSTGYSACQAARFNKELSKDIKRKVITEHIIPAHKKQSVLLFAKKVPETFDFKLFDPEHQRTITFNVVLKR